MDLPHIVVIGGTGFIGSHVVRYLLKEQADVRCLVRKASNQSNLNGLNLERVEGDLNDPASLRQAMSGCDTLYHVAADYRLWVADPAEMERTNVQGSRAILQAAADAGVKRVVYTSSVAAVGRPQENGHLGIGREDLDPSIDQQIGPYKRSKFNSELIAREFAKKGLSVVIVNPAAPIGSQDIKPTPTGKMIIDTLKGKMPAYVDTGMNFIDVEDVAQGHILAAKRGHAGERYILGHRNMTLKDFLNEVARIAGVRGPSFRIPYAVAWMAGAVSTAVSTITRKEPAIPLDGVRMAHAPMYYDASKAVKELGLPQTPIELAIEKAIRWFKSHGYV
jgi:dihydroflavonol-4-reductase